MTELISFLKAIDEINLSATDRAAAILWYVGREDITQGMSAAQICKVFLDLGHPKQNISRINANLSANKKMFSRVPGKKDDWRLHPRGRKELDISYESTLGLPKQPKATDSVLPKALFLGTRGYIEKVVLQINASYDSGLYDCCAVMCRRLVETLIIEIYESKTRTIDIKGSDGHFYMLADLLKIFEADSTFTVSRNAKKGLQDFKKLGDLSAHNRRFNARKVDIDQVQGGLRIACEELLHIAKLI